MLYSPERNSLAGTAQTGSVLPNGNTGVGVHSGKRHTLFGVKDANRSSMGRGNKRISTLSTYALRALLLFLLVGTGAAVANAQSASAWSKKGQDAETRQDYDAAYEDYHQAVLKAPKDLRYKSHYERMKFQASVSHVDRGRVLKQSGDIGGAVTEFTRALEIDPSNQTAQQEIDLLQGKHPSPGAADTTSPSAPPPPSQQPTSHEETLNDIGSISGPIALRPVSDEPITLHMVEDVKVIYQAIGKAAGLNVLFDPDYTSKRIPVDLTNVTLADALRIVGTISGTFYKPVTDNTIFVAQNTRTKRQDLEEEAVQTFYLTNASQQADANEIQTAIRNLLDPSIKINLVPSQNAIVMRATPDQLLLAQKILNDLDRAKPEVVVDVAILEVNRDKLRNLGITLPQSVTVTPQASPSATSTSTTTTTGNTTTTTSNFTLNSLANLNATNFAVSITGGTLNALLTDTDTRILQNPRIRATDGQRASLKIGQRIPIATGSYNAGVSTGVASIGVQTQFTYLDVGVNIDMTPTVHFDHQVTLKMKIEVSSQAGSVTISGVTEPIIGQRVVDQVIQLKEGEPSILAGILTKQDNRGVSGTPGLGELPFFKYFFSSQSKEVQQDEIVFLLIPHIVRESILTRLNTRAIDTGTGQAVELRHDFAAALGAGTLLTPVPTPTAGQATTAANAANAMVQQLKQAAMPPTPPTSGQTSPGQTTPPTQNQTQPSVQPPPQTAAPGGPPISLSVVPSNPNQAVGSTFQVSVSLANGHDVYAVPIQLQFNPAVLQLVNVDAGDFLSRDGQAVALVHRDEGNGLVTISSSRPPNVAGISGQGNVATLTFKAIGAGDSALTLVKVGARNSAQANLPAVGSQAVVHVK
jgi:general secretion pathway protein D